MMQIQCALPTICHHVHRCVLGHFNSQCYFSRCPDAAAVQRGIALYADLNPENQDFEPFV